MSIRSHLLLLVLGALLPVVAFAIFASTLVIESEQANTQRGASERVRALMSAIDSEVRGHFLSLELLGSSSLLQADDLKSFHAELVRVLPTQPAWLNVVLMRPDGRQVVNAKLPMGAALPVLGSQDTLKLAVATRRTQVGGIVRSPLLGRYGVPLDTPVLRDGKVIYVLSALIAPESFQQLIVAQQLPEGWVSGLVAADTRFIARVPPQPIGSISGARFREAVARAPEGWFRGPTVEGHDAFTAHITSRQTGWHLGLGLPAEVVQMPVKRALWLMVGGVLLSVVVALFLAYGLGQRIVAPIDSIGEAAKLMRSGVRWKMQDPGQVKELGDVAVLLGDAAAAVSERQALLEREKLALESSDHAKDEFIAMLSHELRNPLAGLVSASQVLNLADANHEAAVRAREIIDRQTRHMARLVEDLLDVSRIVVGKANLKLEPLDLGEVVRTLVDTWRASGRFDRNAVIVEAASAWIQADRARVEQIVSNIVDNALKFSEPGQEIRIGVREEGGRAIFQVTDKGIGLSPEVIGRVFDPFLQVGSEISRSKGGMGLGLTLVRRLAELQGGKVSAQSRGEGQGSVFTVSFPLTQAMAGKAVTAKAMAKPGRRRVLVIEDNDDGRYMLAVMLGFNGHEVLESPNGRKGIELALEHRPDVILVDIGLPDMDGYQVARTLRADERTRNAVIIALTGYGQEEDRRRAQEAGFDAHLLKPVLSDALEQVIAGAA
jgi:signal transduction histidine kinase